MSNWIDTDKYYTPPAVANRAFECAKITTQPLICADTACGSGSLLSAAQDVLQAKYCIGIDKDREIIHQLRRERPEWRLYIGDLLKRHRAPPINFPGAAYSVDLLVLNPPFSLGSKKFVSVNYSGQPIKCSVAMAHILRSLELFTPTQGAIAVVPESLLYSDTDQSAREILEKSFSMSEFQQLSIYTFRGARVNSSFVQIGTKFHGTRAQKKDVYSGSTISTLVVRGGLPMHTFKRVDSGIKVIHSTSLKSIAIKGFSVTTDFTSAAAKGRIIGWMLLIPRVGVPKDEAFRAVYSTNEVQLSDCVIGMQFKTKDEALHAQSRVLANWQSLINLYRGTGARYITISRLINWLSCIGIVNNGMPTENFDSEKISGEN